MPASSALSLADRLILFRYFNRLFGADSFEKLQDLLRNQPTGYDSAGRSHFYNALKGVSQIPESQLARYDANLRDDLRAINRHRPEPITLKYFQYLAALYTEIFLDRCARGQADFLRDLNAFVASENALTPWHSQYQPFTADDLNKLAFWMATGSGKTLLLHINYHQMRRYRTKPFDNILLIPPPGELLAGQHLDELHLSGIPCLTYDQDLPIGERNPIRVIEISKLTENKTGGGVTKDVEAFEGNNLIFVDEGHKGMGGEAWRNLRSLLGAYGLTFEYSATFGQAMSPTRNPDLAAEYSKAIVMDYSYKYFHDDGYGKEYRVLNLREDYYEDLTDTFMLANLLAFYEQLRVFEDERSQVKPYNLEAPLWIFVGGKVSVNAVQTEAGEKKSDVLRVALFLDRLARDDDRWAERTIKDLLDGRTELKDDEGRDLLAGRLEYLRRLDLTPTQIYHDILDRVFHAKSRGGLRLIEIKDADGEIGLKVGTSDEYFGVINIGDTSAFYKLVEAEPALSREEDKFTPSLFDAIKRSDSPINILIGSKKFIEGWDSYRVSTMGLLNVGRSEGPQIIQLFGRGVRLRGKDRSLMRSAALPASHPAHLTTLETLNIFGVRADYMSKFRDYLEKEGIPVTGYEEINVPIRVHRSYFKQGLMIPALKKDADFNHISITLTPDLSPVPLLDLRPQLTALDSTGNTVVGVATANGLKREFSSDVLSLLDWDRIYLDLLDFKHRNAWHNLHIPRQTLREIIDRHQYTLYASDAEVQPRMYADLARVQKTVVAILEKYVEAFYSAEQTRWERNQLEYHPLAEDNPNVSFKIYKIKVPATDTRLVQAIKDLVDDATRLYTGQNHNLPRLNFDRHLYQPLLLQLNDIKASPPAIDAHESNILQRLREWMDTNPSALVGKDLFVLRNIPKVGVGFFETAGFFPDFILWIKEGGKQCLTFIEPHGMKLDSAPTDEKVQLHRRIKEIERELGNPNITLESWIVSTTPISELQKGPAWAGYTRADFGKLQILFEDDDLSLIFERAFPI